MLEQQAVSVINDVLPVHQVGMTASDWTAIMALLFSIGTLIWQKILRTHDLEQQRKNQRADAEMRKWSAEYPHKLKIFTDFYDVLFRFVNYKGTPKRTAVGYGKDMTLVQMHIDELLEFYSQINRIYEECKILFPGEIENEVCKIYKIMKDFIFADVCQDKGNMFNVAIIVENNPNCAQYKTIVKNAEEAQNSIKKIILESDLRQKFIQALEFKGSENE